jgi:hypothetical protein
MFEQRDLSFIHKYFTGEKQESLVFIILGIIAIVLAIVFFFFSKTSPDFFKGAAIPLLALGLIQLIVGSIIYSRSDKQRIDVSYKAGIEPVRFVKMEELPRMRTVMKNFVLYRWLEIVFILIGLLFIFLFRTNPGKAFWYGFGITLTVQTILLFGADLIAERRGKVYITRLETIIYPN